MNVITRFLMEVMHPTKSGEGTLIRLEDSDGNFKPGDVYRATVSDVRDVGVRVRMPACRGSAIVSTKCWGVGAERAEALAKVKCGDTLDVVVKSYNRCVKTLSLVLKGCEHMLPQTVSTSSKPVKRSEARRVPKLRNTQPVCTNKVPLKLAYRPFPEGTTLLIDTANLIGKLGPKNVALRLSTLIDILEGRGYKALLFWEHRAVDWALSNQLCQKDFDDLKAFTRRIDVSLVGEEADLALLQAAQEIPNSVIVTRDRLGDYADVFPDIVATERHRSFSVVPVDGKILLTIFGLKDAVVLPDALDLDFVYPAEEVTDTCSEVAIDDGWQVAVDDEVLLRRATPPQVEPCRHGLLGAADGCILQGDVQRGLELLGRVARKQPKVYHEMADVFQSHNELPYDNRKAMRYDQLADRLDKVQRERKRRICRLRAERRRSDMGYRALADAV